MPVLNIGDRFFEITGLRDGGDCLDYYKIVDIIDDTTCKLDRYKRVIVNKYEGVLMFSGNVLENPLFKSKPELGIIGEINLNLDKRLSLMIPLPPNYTFGWVNIKSVDGIHNKNEVGSSNELDETKIEEIVNTYLQNKLNKNNSIF